MVFSNLAAECLLEWHFELFDEVACNMDSPHGWMENQKEACFATLGNEILYLKEFIPNQRNRK